jgi:hypothetical protein
MELSVQGLLQRHYEPFALRHRLPRHWRCAAHDLATCKTAAQGRHSRRCPQGHVDGVWYNSCRHRSCPRCGVLDRDRWLEGRLQWLLPCAHYHLVFTLPSELDELWALNTKLLTELLFDTARWALAQMLADSRRLAATPGILAVLHTWGRTLCLHPHLHCLLTAGGIDAQSRWRAPGRTVLLPCRPLGILFRGRFLGRLERLAKTGKLRLPADYRALDFTWLLRRCARRKWTPHVSAPYIHGRGVLLYLARYIRGGPFRDSALVAADHRHVSFRYRNWRDLDIDGRPSPDILRLSVDDFLFRLLSHVPTPHTRTVRGWGLYAHTQRRRAEAYRQQLATDLSAEPSPVEPTPRSHPLRCPICGSRLLIRQLHPSYPIEPLAKPPPAGGSPA